MKTFTISLLFLIGTAASLWSQEEMDYSITGIPLDLLKDANEVVRWEESRYVVKSVSQAAFYYKQVITLLNDKSDAAEIRVPYDADSKVKALSVTVYDALGKELWQLKKKDFQDLSAVSGGTLYQDDRVLVGSAQSNDYPYTIKYEYELQMEGLMMIGFLNWQVQTFHQSVQYGKYMLEHPKDLPYRSQLLNASIEPTTQEDEGVVIETWEVKDLPAIPHEAYCPPYFTLLPMLRLSPERIKLEDYEGEMKDWKSFGAFNYQLYEGRDHLPESVEQEIEALIQQARTKQEVIALLYKYLQENTRYVSVQLGIGGWQPFDAAYVAQNKYGDCKALTNFMKALLKKADITAYPVLVQRGNQPYFRLEDSFAASSFNHVLLYVPSEDMWLECTASNYPCGFVGRDNENRKGLLLTESGGQLIDMPSSLTAENRQETQAVIELDAEGNAGIRLRERLTGLSHQWARLYADWYSKEDLEKEVLDDIPLNSFELERWEWDLHEGQPEVTKTMQLSVQKLASKAGRRLFVPLNSFHANEWMPEDTEERRLPLYRASGQIQEDSIRFILPEGYELESGFSEPMEVTSRFGTYRASLQQEEGAIIYTRTLEVHPFELPASVYAELREFYKEITVADRKKMVLVKPKT